MKTVLALAQLISVVGCMSTSIECPVDMRAEAEILRLEQALEFFKLEVGRYPTQTEGLASLVSRPESVPEDTYGPAGYMKRDGLWDPWENLYLYSWPSACSLEFPRLVSLGADGQPGGSGQNADISNCEN